MDRTGATCGQYKSTSWRPPAPAAAPAGGPPTLSRSTSPSNKHRVPIQKLQASNFGLSGGLARGRWRPAGSRWGRDGLHRSISRDIPPSSPRHQPNSKNYALRQERRPSHFRLRGVSGGGSSWPVARRTCGDVASRDRMSRNRTVVLLLF
jgi:hypothetical protein